MKTKSRWATWSSGTEIKKGYHNFFVIEATTAATTDTGNPTGSGLQTPAEKAKAMGLQSNGHGSYFDPNTGEIKARTVNGELIFYDHRATGGAISDGSGGAALTQSSPSWKDPASGMIIVPPATPETPEEEEVVPDPIPATPPYGYAAHIQKRKEEVTKEVEAQQAADAEDEAIEKYLRQNPVINKYYTELNDQLINSQSWEETLAIFDGILKVKEYVKDGTFDELDDGYYKGLFYGIKENIPEKFEILKAEKEFEELENDPLFQAMGPEDRKPKLKEIEKRINKANEEIESNNDFCQEIIEIDKKASAMNRSVRDEMIDPEYDLNQKGIEIGNGEYGTVIDPGDGNVIKTGTIPLKEAEILARLKGTGVAPIPINYEVGSISQQEVYTKEFRPQPTGKYEDRIYATLAMTKVKGIPVDAYEIETDEDTEDLLQNFLKARYRMHLSGVVHNDSHGGNLIRDPDTGRISIVDYGISDISYPKAVMEALGFISGKDYMANLSSYQLDESKTVKKLKENYRKARNFISTSTPTVDEGWPKRFKYDGGIRLDENEVDEGEVPEETWKEILNILYDGFIDYEEEDEE